MAKRGRPKKNPEELLTYPRFGVTSAELEQLTEIADQNEVSVSYLIRAAGTAILRDPELAEQLLAGMADFAKNLPHDMTAGEFARACRALKAGEITQGEFDRKISADYAENQSRST